jgi:hypothetical protein
VSEFTAIRPNLEVTELGPTVEHLQRVLGFEVDIHEEEMGLVLLHRDAVGLAVVRTPSPAVNETTASYVSVTDIENLHDRCASKGARIVSSLTDHPWGLRDFVVEIPGGHRLAFGERIAS